VHLDGTRPRRLSRLLATALRCGALATGAVVATAAVATAAGAVAMPSEAASGSVHHVEGPPGISASIFGSDFAVMAKFEPLAKAGRGKVAVLLPGTPSAESIRTAGDDSAVLEHALRSAGLARREYVVQSAGGSDATQYSDAVKDISNGARVIVLDPINSGVGAQIEAYAMSQTIPVIDYDQLTLGGSRRYEVGFDAAETGQLMGHGLARCAAAWHVSRPHVAVIEPDSSGNAASLLAEGYDRALHPLVRKADWVILKPTSTTGDAATQFRSIVRAHHDVNAALAGDPETSSAIVTALKAQHIRSKSFPAAGVGVSVPALDDVLSGYLCGTVYQPVVREAQAAVALALYLRAGASPPHSLVNGTTEDTTAEVPVPSVSLPAAWVTAGNLKSTVVRDGTVRAAELCSTRFADACAAAGLAREKRAAS
jgi:D-xylose transport system substrate-binding protein